MAAFHANNRNGGMLLTRNERSMPKWVTEQTDRIGPKPPPPPVSPANGDILPKEPNLPPKTKTMPEPDYEVIEFSNQQYSNTPLRPNSASSGSKTPDNKLKCTLCGSGNPWVTCDECAQQIFCVSCDDMFHKHPKRKNHQRKTIEKSIPPLPPKTLPGQSGPTPPVAPPRRNKRGLMTPLMQRKDQGNSMPGPFPVPSSPTPSQKNTSWQERFGSLPRGLNLLNRPLPETPKTPPSESSRSTTPKSVFDNIQRPPSVALEKIKNKANATLDRMQLLQQRYRQQKEQMERERSGSVTDQNMSAFDQWSSISQSPSHFRSGSMSSGINSSHLDLMEDNNFNLFHQRQLALQHHQMAAQRANQLGQRALSTSVFNLNQVNRKQTPTSNGWISSPMQQAQSMAQLNCMNCAQQQSQWNGHHHMHTNQDPWSGQLAKHQHLNHSNMSLNVPAGYMMQPQMNGMYPPPTFMNQRGLMQPMYPQSYMGGMPVMNPGLMGMPPSTSRAASRAGSRMASPAMSRKSVTLRRKQRSAYIDDEATDDEDSDEDDRRSIASNRSAVSRSRQRRLSSASQIQLDEDVESPHGKLHRSRARNQRRDSIAKSVHNDWAPGRRGSVSNNNRSVDSGFNSPLKPSRIYSDLDSEGSGTRALVQAKIEQKLKEESLKQKQTKTKRQSQSPTTQKTSAAVQTPAVKQMVKKEEHVEKVEENKSVDKEKQNLANESKVEEEKAAQKDNEESVSETEEDTEEESEEEEEIEENSSKPQTPEPTEELDNNEEETQIVEDDLGPPPSTPDHEWECEFCTYVNEANIKICSICCKTPSVKPKKAVKSISPPKQIKTTSTGTKAEKAPKDTVKPKDVQQVKDKSGTIKKRPTTVISNHSTSNQTMTNNNESSKSENHIEITRTDTNQNMDGANDSSSSNNPKKKETVEDIWATLDENIQATAHEVTRKAESQKPSKVSTTSVETQENDSNKFQAREIGTSPPPQSISTQTYDTINIGKIEAKEDTQTSQPKFNDVQPIKFPSTPKIQDLKSFEAEVLNEIHNISHVPSHHHHHHQHQQQQLHNHHMNHNMYSPFTERQRYRSNNDLRLDDGMSMDFEPSFNGLGRRQPSINELMLLQKSSSQIHSPLGGSIYDLPYRELSSLKVNDMDNQKESDLYRYTTEELNAALKYCGPDMHPLVWLRDNWPKLIQTVQSLATKYGQERAENTIGTISQVEAREALRLHTGNIWQAVSECIEQRQRKYRDISSKGNFSREDIVTALTTHQGNVELAFHDLGRNQLKPFLMRIWGSPGGVENESGSQPIQSSQSTHLNIDRDIHNFLSANASDCMQTPNEAGAYHNNNNQLPSPYDRPLLSFNSSCDNSNHMLDNTSSYSADSKDFTTSPLPLDESILSNKNVLKDLETLIGNMEHNQQKQNEHVLRSIHDMITNMSLKVENEYDPEEMRILTKSPIIPNKYKTTPQEKSSENEADVKNFVWQHIQEIVPNLVQQVENELMEDNEEKEQIVVDNTVETGKLLTAPPPLPPPPPPPVDHDEFLMEEVIMPNTKNASFREELPPEYRYAAEIATFQMVFDKGLEKEQEEEFEFDSLEDAQRNVYKMFKAPSLQQIETPMPVVVTLISTSQEIQTQIIESFENQTITTETEINSGIEATIPIPANEDSSITQNLSKIQATDSLENSSKTRTAIEIENEHLDENTTKMENVIASESSQTQPEHQKETTEPQNIENIDTVRSTSETNALEITEILGETDTFPEVTDINNVEILSKDLETKINESENNNESIKVTKIINQYKRSEPKDLSKVLEQVEVETTTSMNSNLVLSGKPSTNNLPPITMGNTTNVVDVFNNTNQNLISSSQEAAHLSMQMETKEEDSVVDDTNLPTTTKNDKTEAISVFSYTNRNQASSSEASAHSSTQAKAKEADTASIQADATTLTSPVMDKKTQVISVFDNTTNNQILSKTKEVDTAPNQVDTINLQSTTTNDKTPQIAAVFDDTTQNGISSSQEVALSSTQRQMETKPNQAVTDNKTTNPQTKSTKQESKIPRIIKSTSFVQKNISKIPVRRTASNISLISSPTIIPTQIESKTEIKTSESDSTKTLSNPVESQQITDITENLKDIITDNGTDDELYSIASDSSITELASTTEQLQSSVSTNEVILMIQQEASENASTIAPSTSNSTLHSIISQSSGRKSASEFVPSTDPSKQNLSELVEDTQRLIKQMRDEISIDDFESSTDDDEYTDDYTDEYDDGEEEELEDEEWEEEEDEYSQEDDAEEYDVVTEDITEENTSLKNESPTNSNTNLALIHSQDSLNYRDTHNSSVLSNITSESFDHSQTITSDRIIQETNQTAAISVKETVETVNTENNLHELPVENGFDTVLDKGSQASVNLIESETTSESTQEPANPEHDSKDTTALVNGLQNILTTSLSIENMVETENRLPELPVEVINEELSTVDSKTFEQDTGKDSNENVTIDNTASNNTETTPATSEDIQSTVQVQDTNIQNDTATNQSNDYTVTTTAIMEAKITENVIENSENQQNELELPSTSQQQIMKTSTDNKNLEKTNQTQDFIQPSTSKDTKTLDNKKKSNENAKSTTKKPLAASKIPKPKEVSRDQKPKEIKQTAKPQNSLKQKYTRSKSFSGPTTPIGIASVKTISQKFINPPQNSNQTNQMNKKQTTVARKSSIVEAISKFTKPSNETDKPTTSSQLLFKSRTQPRIPKKKYHETCFSDDDYETTSSEAEVEPLEVRQRKLSVPVFRTYPSVQQEPEEVNTEALIEKFMKEELTSSIAEAQIAAALVAMKFQQDVSLWAAKECSDLDHAIALLKQECELCSGTYALNQIVSMLKCTHKCCKQCAKTYFTVQITERSINDCSCPFCKLPELHNQTEHEDENLEYFSNLDIFLKNILEPEVHELFQRKLRDRTLLKDPNFKWCVQCSSGFFARPKQKRLICPDCGSVTCAQCRKPWQKQHEGISCDQFSEWELANDPEIQAKGVQRHLEQNGIDCPKCKFRYSLARGGCMHFTCTQCKYEFCYGCAKPFMMGAKCTISPYCAKLGLHAHHPRNCLFYLRDKLPVQLQILLKNNGVTYEVDPIEMSNDSSKDDGPSSSKKKELLCPIPLQKETPTGLVDTKCNGDVPDKHAGMCRTHYVEYLTAKVAKAKVDPLPIFDLTDCVQELRRRGIPLPERGPWDTDEIYKNMCAEVIQKNIPLDAA